MNSSNNRGYSLAELEKLICEELKVATIPPTIKRQINKYVLEQKMTYKEIARCVVYYVDTMKRTIDLNYGLYFVLNIRETVAKYYEQLAFEEAQRKEKAKVINREGNNIIFNPSKIRKTERKKRIIDISQIDITEGDNGQDDNK